MATVIEGIKFYTIPETAQALRVTPQTIRAWIKQGKLKAIAYWDRVLIKDVVNTALQEAVVEYEKKNGDIKPIPKK